MRVDDIMENDPLLHTDREGTGKWRIADGKKIWFDDGSD